MHRDAELSEGPVRVIRPGGTSSVLLVCEHASAFIPPEFANLGLSTEARRSHAAWDPGALAVAEGLSARLDAALVSGTVSRLVYDCNRPPDAPDAMRERSEVFDVPGNRNLSAADRAARVRVFYDPFRAALADRIARAEAPVIVTLHSFTPVFHGQRRAVEIGVLHDSDARLADAMLAVAGDHTDAVVRRNEPYGPDDGVTHTLRAHAVAGGHPNVMLEIRSDLIATKAQQAAMAGMLAGWLAAAFTMTGLAGAVRCTG
ncbi:N-formylglutamate amidohydrolase [Jannaschia sp. S6380]|uniref:N-formylglutamate amidohydrolase n=1 Tax=Jannaschia sp. S6380 TaxID=2926408 RepID=UPI001FF40A3E|nr:N-formylglutamate amidohydrolase [Jannaschia sp. S6380]MCK0167227.1 N-formylglutamate amidohydrolase [Jannaschia sp. S6380]